MFKIIIATISASVLMLPVFAQQNKISAPAPERILNLDGGLGVMNKFSNTKPLAFGGGVNYSFTNKKGRNFKVGLNYNTLTGARQTLPTITLFYYYQKIITPQFLSAYFAKNYSLTRKIKFDLGFSFGGFSGGSLLAAALTSNDPVLGKYVSDYKGNKAIALGLFTSVSVIVTSKSGITLQYQPMISIKENDNKSVYLSSATRTPEKMSSIMLKLNVAVWQK